MVLRAPALTSLLLPLQGTHGKHGYTNASGAFALTLQFFEAFNFRDDLAATVN